MPEAIASVVGASLLAIPPGLGPVPVGAPFEEIRRSLPDVAWVESNPYRFSGQPRQLSAATGVRIADLSFSAHLARGHHGRYSIELQHEGPAVNADDCEQQARAVFMVIEPQTGPMEPSGELIDNEYAEPIGARSSIKLSQTLDDAMRKPVSREKLKGRQPAHRWWRATGLRTEEALPVQFRFQMDYARRGGDRACVIRVEAEREPAAPPPLHLEFADLTPARTPSIALRHLLVSRLAAGQPLPADGVERTVPCRVNRNSGTVERCDLPSLPVEMTPEEAIRENAT